MLNDDFGDAEAEAFADTIDKQTKLQPYPQNRPFDTIFISPCGLDGDPSKMLDLTEIQASIFFGQDLSQLGGPFRECSYSLMGFLISESRALIFIKIKHHPRNMSGQEYAIAPSCLWSKTEEYLHGSGWLKQMSNAAWIIPGLVDYLNSFQRFIVSRNPTFGERYNFKRKLKTIPKPYYEIRLQQEVVYDHPEQAWRQADSPSSGDSSHYSYRFGVKGHEACRILRGTLPLDKKYEQKLLKRGYKVYTITSPSEKDAERLLVRHRKPKGAREWLAILSYFRDGYKKGPVGAPYIPAIRTT